MTTKVGPKGQIVISKEIRDRFGIQTGWQALQRVSGDHVEIYFLPPEHNKSLKGSLSRYTKVKITTDREWTGAREKAWVASTVSDTAIREKTA
jgi:AbrB family looped-hinge helix DNA binding protein